MAARRVLNLTFLAWGLAVPVVFLAAIGLVTIHATDRSVPPPGTPELLTPGTPAPTLTTTLRGYTDRIGENTIRQSLYLLSGVGLMFLFMVPPYQWLGRFAFAAYWLITLLLALLVIDRFVDLPLIPVIRNTRRWIEFGIFRLQPSEFIKLGLVVALARYLRFRKSYRRLWGLVPPFLLTILPMLLILLQPDLGTLLMLLPVLFTMLFVAGARMRHLASIVFAGLAVLPLFYFFGMADYQKQRVEVLLKQRVDDERWHMGPGYQLRQSKTALGIGGLSGVGYGQGAFIRFGLLPEEHNDFIFAIIGNQWGFVGCLLILLAYGVIVIVGIEVATVTNEPFGRLLAIGVVVMISAQALINIGMTIGLAPITGMTLPFVSFGGSSVWVNFMALGLLINVAQRRPMLIANAPFEYSED